MGMAFRIVFCIQHISGHIRTVPACNRMKSRDKYLDQIVNILNVRDYVTFSDMEEYDQCDFLLGKRHVGEIELSDQEWELFVLHSARHFGLVHDEMRTLLSVEYK